jgi:membrane protease YdiL (CAAX protease family)
MEAPGLQFCFAGLLLIGIFTQRLIVGRSSLPLTLPAASLHRHDHPEVWRRTQLLIWVLIGPLFLTTSLILIPMMASPHFLHYLRSPSFLSLGNAAQILLLLAAARYILGSSAVPLLRRALRLPSEKGFLLAAIFSIGIPVLISAGEYLFDRAGLLPRENGTIIWAPGTFFHYPEASLLLLFFPALLEEIIFRGFLQSRLTQRYGIVRGIFLVGIVWSAFHVPSDFAFSHFGTWDALQQLVFRLSVCIPLSFVFGWLTLETGSVLAAALAHTSYNVLLYSNLGPPFPGKNWLRLALWAALAWLLFRYFPVKRGLQSPTVPIHEPERSQSSPAEPSPAPENT